MEKKQAQLRIEVRKKRPIGYMNQNNGDLLPLKTQTHCLLSFSHDFYQHFNPGF